MKHLPALLALLAVCLAVVHCAPAQKQASEPKKPLETQTLDLNSKSVKAAQKILRKAEKSAPATAKDNGQEIPKKAEEDDKAEKSDKNAEKPVQAESKSPAAKPAPSADKQAAETPAKGQTETTTLDVGKGISSIKTLQGQLHEAQAKGFALPSAPRTKVEAESKSPAAKPATSADKQAAETPAKGQIETTTLDVGKGISSIKTLQGQLHEAQAKGFALPSAPRTKVEAESKSPAAKPAPSADKQAAETPAKGQTETTTLDVGKGISSIKTLQGQLHEAQAKGFALPSAPRTKVEAESKSPAVTPASTISS